MLAVSSLAVLTAAYHHVLLASEAAAAPAQPVVTVQPADLPDLVTSVDYHYHGLPRPYNGVFRSHGCHWRSRSRSRNNSCELDGLPW